MDGLLYPKEVTVKDIDGNEKTFIISKMPAMDGRELVAKYPVSALPKVGDYKTNVETMLLMMQYVGVKTETGLIRLKTKALIDNHLTDWGMLGSLELEMLEYNTNFLKSGKASKLLDSLENKVTEWTSKMLTDLLERYSQKNKQR